MDGKEKEGDGLVRFFLGIVPPTTTHQQKKVAVIGGKPRFYEDTKLKAARQEYRLFLRRHRPEVPMEGPLMLTTKWIFPASKTNKPGWKATRPDTDNLIKLLKDCMTEERFWHDDSQVAVDIVAKCYGSTPGIDVAIEPLNGVGRIEAVAE